MTDVLPGAPAEAPPLTVTLDGRSVPATKGELVISVAEREGRYVPRFCYHPRMKPVGMCRMCLVEVSGPRGATLQPACFVSVADGMEITTDSPAVKKAQEGVLEFLLINHPLDCPVCDKGGECPLQDQTLAYGPGESRFVEEKRHWAKPVPISELVDLDRERCIQCARCTRFAEEIAGEAQIDFAGRGDHTEVAIFPGAPFRSYFSGNTVQICPVGALTARPYRFAARPWDLEQVESTCTTCALGCRVAVQSSADRVVRMLGLDAGPVNQSWLCDRGRFGYEALESGDRLREPEIAGESATWAEALEEAAARLSEVRLRHGASAIGVIGGARLANEDAYAWARLAKGILGTDNVDTQLGDGLPPELVLSLPRATIDDAASARLLVVYGADLREELPVLHLRLRDAVVHGGVPLVELNVATTGLRAHATHRVPLDASGPGSVHAALEAIVGGHYPEVVGEAGDGMVVVCGRSGLGNGEADAARIASLAERWPEARFLPVLRRGNVFGALDMGLAPGLLPGRVRLEDGRERFAKHWGAVPAERGLDTAGMLGAIASGDLHGLVCLGADPFTDFPGGAAATRALHALDGLDVVIAIDTHRKSLHERCRVVLPAAAWAERAGTTTNLEGRVSRLSRKVSAPGVAWPDWMIASELAHRLGDDFGFASLEAITSEVASLAPAYAGLDPVLLATPGAADGVVAPLGSPVSLRVSPVDPVEVPGVASAEHQGAPLHSGGGAAERTASGRPSGTGPAAGTLADSTGTLERLASAAPPAGGEGGPADGGLALACTRTLYDRGELAASAACLTRLVPDRPRVRAHPAELATRGLAGGDRVAVSNGRGRVVGDVEPDTAMARGVVAVDWNTGDVPVAVLLDAGASLTHVELSPA